MKFDFPSLSTMFSAHETTISVESSSTKKSREASQVEREIVGLQVRPSTMLIHEHVLSSRTRENEKLAGHVLETWDVKSVVSETEIIPIILNGKLHVFKPNCRI